MSVKAMSRVWELQLHHAERLVLLALADHADHLGANIYPSIGLIAWKTGYSESQVRRIMQQLVTVGFLNVVRSGGGRGNATVYRFDLEAGTVKAPYVNGDGGSGGTMTPIPAKPGTVTPIIGNGRTMTPFADNPSTLTPIEPLERVSFDELKGVISDLKGVIAMTPEPFNHQLRTGGDARAHTHTREGPPPPLFEKRDTGDTDGDDGDGDVGHDPYESLLEIDFAPIQATWALAAYQAASIALDVAEVARIAAYVCENPAGKNNPAAYLASQWKRGKVAPLRPEGTRPPAARRGPAWDNENKRFEPQPALVPDDVLAMARRLREESDRRAVPPGEVVGLGGLAAALSGPVLRSIAPSIALRPPLPFPGKARL